MRHHHGHHHHHVHHHKGERHHHGHHHSHHEVFLSAASHVKVHSAGIKGEEDDKDDKDDKDEEKKEEGKEEGKEEAKEEEKEEKEEKEEGKDAKEDEKDEKDDGKDDKEDDKEDDKDDDDDDDSDDDKDDDKEDDKEEKPPAPESGLGAADAEKLQLAKDKKLAIEHELDTLKDDAAFDAEVKTDVAAVQQETNATSLAQFLGDMWQEMRMLAQPMYIKHMKEELAKTEAEILALEAKASNSTKSADLLQKRQAVGRNGAKAEQKAQVPHGGAMNGAFLSGFTEWAKEIILAVASKKKSM